MGRNERIGLLAAAVVVLVVGTFTSLGLWLLSSANV